MEKLNLYQKLIEIRKEIAYAKKASKGYNFSYASESQILAAIRPKMDELGVFLEMEMVSLETVPCSMLQKDGKVLETGGLRATFEFIWTDAAQPDQQIKRRVILQDAQSTIKEVGGIMTYANRYFLYKFFAVPTDKDDPDAFENSRGRAVTGSSTPRFLSEEQINQIVANADDRRVANICRMYGVSNLGEVNEQHFDFIMGNLQKKAAAV